MKFKILLLSAAISSSIIAAAAAPGPDYSKIRKDLNVMSQVVKSAFNNNDSCKGCSVKVDTNYLAKQGAVFTINTYLSQRSHSYSSAHSDGGENTFVIGDSTFDRLAPLTELEVLEELGDLENIMAIPEIQEIQDMVGNILVGVGESLEEAGTRIELFDREWDQHTPHIRIDRSSRLASRELSREVRDIAYEIRDLEIELLHANDSDEQKNIEKRMNTLEDKLAKVEAKRDKFEDKQRAKKSEFDKRKELQRLKRKQENNKILVDVQDIVLQSFCDYGSTLKHIPLDEKISVVFHYVRKHKDTIFVLDKDDVSNCGDTKKLKATALTYLF